MDRKKELFNNIIIFAFGTVGSKIIQFVLVPLYTACLTTTEYSIADIIVSTITLIMPFLTIGIGHGILRFVLNKTENRKSVLKLSLTICCLGTIVLLLLYPAYKNLDIFDKYSIFIPILFLTGSINSILQGYCKAIDLNKEYAINGILSSLMLTGTNILLIACLKIGVVGYLTSILISNIVSNIYLMIKCRVLSELIGAKIDKKISAEMIAYSLPLMPNELMWWVIQMSDRYMLVALCGYEINGVYSMAYKIPSILNLMVSIFIQAFGISAIKECDYSMNKNGIYDCTFFDEIYPKYITATFVASTILIVASRPLAKIIFRNDFYDAWKFTPLLLIAYSIGNLQSFYGSLYSGIKKTKEVMITTAVGAVTNVILNYVLIPKYGGYGAAIATILGYAMVYYLRVILIKKHINMNHFVTRTTVSLITLVAIGAFYIMDNYTCLIISLILSALMIIIYKDDLILMIKEISRMGNLAIEKFKNK